MHKYIRFISDGGKNKPLREPVLEGAPIDLVPPVGLSQDPVKSKPELSSKQTNPTPSPIFTFSWYMIHSINPNQAYAHKHRDHKEPIEDSTLSYPCFKQWKIPITSHLCLCVSLQLAFFIYYSIIVLIYLKESLSVVLNAWYMFNNDVHRNNIILSFSAKYIYIYIYSGLQW